MPALRETLGDKAFEELEGLIVEKVKLYSVSRDELREVLSRLDIIEHDVAGLKEEVKGLRGEIGDLRREMNERFDRINERFDSMNISINERFDQMHDRMVSMMKWTVGTLAIFGSIISILLAIGQFMK
ncbi:MAG: hypothetical protein OHK0032_16490 [Thermodesulfovibrionales bacterium]